MMPDAKWYANWVRMIPAESAAEKMRNLEAADLIESLAAELEQVKQERDGLNILLGQAQSMLETRTRERNAAIRQLLEADKNNPFACSYCKHDDVCDGRLAVCGDCGMDGCPCNTCINHSNWQWRGIQKEDWHGTDYDCCACACTGIRSGYGHDELKEG